MSVVWITGLSGAGKTTIGKRLYDELKPLHSNLVFIDGDVMREVLGNGFGHSLDDRFELAMTYSRLCKFLHQQSINVICCTVSMFHDIRKWNRDNIDKYNEIYVRVPLSILKERDQKGLYSGAERGTVQNVIGIDLPFEEPQEPDVVINNDGTEPLENLIKSLLIKLETLK